MTATVTIAPVRKSIRVNARRDHAFEVFTSGLGRWWPRKATIGKSPLKMAVMEPRLGGRRRLPKGVASPDTWWRVESFRAYAAYMRTEEFGDALTELLAGLDAARTLIMCSESLWWRCHRRMVSDAAALLHGVDVHHLAHDGTLAPHRPSAGARVVAGQLVYVGGEGSRAPDETG